MVSVIQVYEAVRDLCNKDQKGFITPAVFNRFAALAQQNIFNEMFNELKIATKLRRAGSDAGRDNSAYKAVEEDLNYFISQVTLNVAEEEGTEFVDDGQGSEIEVFIHETAIANLPSNVARVINMTVVDSGAAVEIIYDSEKLERVLKSNLSAPTEDFPVAFVSPIDIEIFPQSVSFVTITYYAKPTSFDSNGEISLDPPFYDFNVVNYTGESLELFNAANSRNFMLPSHCLNEVVMEMAKLIGIRLRDQQVSVFSTQEEAAE